VIEHKLRYFTVIKVTKFTNYDSEAISLLISDDNKLKRMKSHAVNLRTKFEVYPPVTVKNVIQNVENWVVWGF